jgi:hypothetical protein
MYCCGAGGLSLQGVALAGVQAGNDQGHCDDGQWVAHSRTSACSQDGSVRGLTVESSPAMIQREA